MKKALCIAIEFLACQAVGTAFAADMAVKAPLLPNPPPSWSGFYIGVNAGAASTSYDYSLFSDGAWFTQNPAVDRAFNATNGSPDLHRTGIIGGGQVGYNLQFNQILWGLEADIDGIAAHASRSSGTLIYPGIPFPVAYTENASVDWLATVRPRVGTTFGRSLLYATGGLAVGGTHSNAALNVLLPGGYSSFGSSSQTSVGWAAGAGWEFLVTNNVSVKAEYLHVDLGTENYRSIGSDAGAHFEDISVKTRIDIARIGLNVKFGGFGN